MDYLDAFDHGQILKILVDVTNDAQIETAVKATEDKLGTVDFLVNNAGLGYFATLEESDLKEVEYMFNVNVFGLAKVTKAVLPLMCKQRSGVIVNISSVLGLTTLPTMGYYCASKYAVEAYTDALRQEVSGFGIQVLAVEPSGAWTNWAGKSSQKTVPTIEDYAAFKDGIANMAQATTDSPGDPKAIADLLYVAATKETVPHHLPLGQFAYEGSLANLTKIADEIQGQKANALSADRK